MFYKITAIATLVMISWYGVESMRIKQQQFTIVNKLEHTDKTLSQKLVKIEESIKSNQHLYRKQYDFLLSLDKKIEANKLQIMLLLRDNTKNQVKNINSDKPKEKIGVSKQTITTLMKKLVVIDELHAKKDIGKATNMLKALKEDVWKMRSGKSVDKKSILSLMSSIDVTLKNWAENKDYKTQKIKQRLMNLEKKTQG